jgi:hypothetical protein
MIFGKYRQSLFFRFTFKKHHQLGKKDFTSGIDHLSLNFSLCFIAKTDAVTSVKRQFNDSGSLKVEADVIVFLDNGNDIEKQLIKDGFSK